MEVTRSCSGSGQTDLEILLEPFEHINSIPGKNVRSQLMDAFNMWLNIPVERMTTCCEVVQKLHNASLMIDDIEDNSKLRRGVPVAHLVFGTPATINSANYVYFVAFKQVLDQENRAAADAMITELLNLHRGQGLDIYWRDNMHCPTEEQYNAMVLDKTGGLFRLSVKLMQAFSENKSDFVPLVNDLSLLYQVLDDYQNLKSSSYHENKSFCEDFTEGKFSFPFIHAIRRNAADTRLLNILKQRTSDNDMKRYGLRLLEEAGSFEYTREYLRRVEQQVREHIKVLGGNEGLEAIVAKICAPLREEDSA